MLIKTSRFLNVDDAKQVGIKLPTHAAGARLPICLPLSAVTAIAHA
jgi:hypothetical protein